MQKRILIIDDSIEINDHLANEMLPAYGFATLSATDGRMGMRLIRDELPDLIMLDLNLPEMSGLDILEMMAKDKVTIPVILMTGFGTEQSAVEAFRLGIKDYLIKPFAANEAIQVISRIFANEPVKRGSIEPETKGETAVLLARLQARQASFHSRLGHYPEAKELLRHSLTVFKQYNESKEMAFALVHLGNIAHRLGDVAEAKEFCDQSLLLSQVMGDQYGMIISLQNLGDIADIKGDYKEAGKLYKESLNLSRTLDNQRGEAIALNQLGYIDWRLGHYEDAKQQCHESLSIYQELVDRRGISMCLKNLGNVAADLNHFSEATEYYNQGLQICEETGDQWGVALFFNNLGNMSRMSGAYQKGIELCQKSLMIWREIGYQMGMATVLETLGGLEEAMERYKWAKSYYREGLEIAVAIKAIPLVLNNLVGVAALMGQDGQLDEAMEIISFVLNHRGADQDVKDKANGRLATLLLHAPEKKDFTAQKSGINYSLDQLTTKILANSI